MVTNSKEATEYAEEAAIVERDSETVQQEMLLEFPSYPTDPRQIIPWYEKRIALLDDERFNPVARLAVVSKSYSKTVKDYIKKLKLADEGNTAAVAAVREMRQKIPEVIKFEKSHLVKMLEDKKAEAARLETTGSKWARLREQAEKEMEAEKARRAAILPRDKKDEKQWQAYYTVRLERLTNEALTLPARLLWTTIKPPRAVEKLISEYLYTLKRLSVHENFEEQLHRLEAEMRSIITADADYVRVKLSGQGGI